MRLDRDPSIVYERDHRSAPGPPYQQVVGSVRVVVAHDRRSYRITLMLTLARCVMTYPSALRELWADTCHHISNAATAQMQADACMHGVSM